MNQARNALMALAAALACAAAQPAAAQAAGTAAGTTPARQALRVCQDPNNLPFSNTQGEGIENRIAEVFGKALGLPVTYYSFPQRLAFMRNTLRYKLPGEDYRCDIVMGVPVGFDEVAVTKPYYRSTYALVFAPQGALAGVSSVEQFLQLDSSVLAKLRIGVYDRQTSSEWLNRHGLLDSGVPYQTMNADPAQYPGEIIEKDLAAGKLDAVVAWGPLAGFFAKRIKTPVLTVLPLHSEPGLQLDYEMAMGVRYGEREWKQQVESLIDAHRAEIEAILKEYGVPLVDESYSAPRGKPKR